MGEGLIMLMIVAIDDEGGGHDDGDDCDVGLYIERYMRCNVYGRSRNMFDFLPADYFFHV